MVLSAQLTRRFDGIGIMKVRFFAISAMLVSAFLGTVQTAGAQGFIKKSTEELPKVQFYMARQQWQVVDDSPIVNYKQGAPGQQPQQPGQSGGMLNRPAPLPRAGFQQYSPQAPTFGGGLPQVVNGVPPKDVAPAPVKHGKKAKAGKLGPGGNGSQGTTTASKPNQPVSAAKAYSPYKGYNPQSPPPAQGPGTGLAANQNNQTRTNVKGSVLHWARGGR